VPSLLKHIAAGAVAAFLLCFQVVAGPPVVVDATAMRTGDQVRFDVTIQHADTGWDHYADGWGVYAPDGTELGYRTLFHPHVEEQPFTRSLTIALPPNVTEVSIRPRDSVHGEGTAFPLRF